jgi:hypothetical protein
MNGIDIRIAFAITLKMIIIRLN